MNSAAQKNKDAEERLKTLTAKMANLNAELAKIQSDYESDVASFTAATSAETQATIARTQRDLVSKLEGEKNELVEKLNEELLNNVIAKTQQTISGNSDMKKRATTNIVSGLR
jgi:F0F1-type ATP synthase membrane subunit b/b'